MNDLVRASKRERQNFTFPLFIRQGAPFRRSHFQHFLTFRCSPFPARWSITLLLLSIVRRHCSTLQFNIKIKFLVYPFQYASRHDPFLYNVQYKRCTELIIVPIKFFLRLADFVKDPEPKLVLLSNMGRCGSTLLTQMFEAVPGIVTMSEPSFMSTLVSTKWKTQISVRDHL